jgi:hypothetical protein
MELLRNTNGTETTENIVTLAGPNYPLGHNGDTLIQLLASSKKLFKQTDPHKIDPKLKAWASGTGKAHIFKEKALSNYFKMLFKIIQSSFPKIKLNVANLFHGHILYDDKLPGGDIIIVFHAFEYPKDLEPYRFQKALEWNPKLKAFYSSDKAFLGRNLIFSLKKNKIWRVYTSKKSLFHHIVRSPAYEFYPDIVSPANSAQPSHFGLNIGEINYFPERFKRPFITRGIGN